MAAVTHTPAPKIQKDRPGEPEGHWAAVGPQPGGHLGGSLVPPFGPAALPEASFPGIPEWGYVRTLPHPRAEALIFCLGAEGPGMQGPLWDTLPALSHGPARCRCVGTPAGAISGSLGHRAHGEAKVSLKALGATARCLPVFSSAL